MFGAVSVTWTSLFLSRVINKPKTFHENAKKLKLRTSGVIAVFLDIHSDHDYLYARTSLWLMSICIWILPAHVCSRAHYKSILREARGRWGDWTNWKRERLRRWQVKWLMGRKMGEKMGEGKGEARGEGEAWRSDGEREEEWEGS